MNFFRRFRKKKILSDFVEPDEIFIDSKNIPQFETERLEGRLEKKIQTQSLALVGGGFLCVLIVFVFRLGVLQIAQGELYAKRADANRLKVEPLFADRGIISDRTGKALAWNTENRDGEPFSLRTYATLPGLSHVVGYVSYPKKDKDGFYWRAEFTGKDGIEKSYDQVLRGKNGGRLVEQDVMGKLISRSTINPPVHGQNITLSIDAELQSALFTQIATVLSETGFRGGGGAVMDIHTGEILALTNAPEYNQTILSTGSDAAVIKEYFSSNRTPLLNRMVAGTYSPGSIMKPYVGIGALTEGAISPNKQIESRGSITIPNPYNPELPSVFRDYDPDNGWVDLRHALAVSSNIYFFNVGGGYRGQKGIGIENIGKYWRLFGFGSKTGIDLSGEKEGTIPSPSWKQQKFPDNPVWRVGDTYNTAIGQYGVQIAPLQALRAVAAIANKGTLVTPHLTLGEEARETVKIDIPAEHWKVIQEGMRLVVTEGTVKNISHLPIAVAAKSGTAQVGSRNQFVNSWVTGFWPYENPKYAFTIFFENGDKNATTVAQRALRLFLEWMIIHKPEYMQ